MVLLAAVLAYYAMFAAAFALLTPPLEAPDETGHLAYVNFVARYAVLPNQTVPERAVVGEGHQFPLYYLLPAIATRLMLADDTVDLRPIPNPASHGASARPGAFPKFVHVPDTMFLTRSDRLAFYALRLYSVMCGAVTVWLTWLIAGRIVLDRRSRLLAAFLVASLPQFLFISGAVNNDNLAIALSAATILALLTARATPSPRNFALLGAALGLALLTKKTSLFLAPGVAMLLLQRLPAARRNVRELLALALTPAIALAISGWVLLRNQRLYGDPLGTQMERLTLSELVDRKGLWSVYWVDTFAPWMARSFVGVFGWMNVVLPAGVYALYAAVAAVGVAGAVSMLRWRALPARTSLIALIAVLLASCVVGVVWYNLTYTQYQGRFLFPVLPLIAALLAHGLGRALARIRSERLAGALVAGLVFAIVAADVASLLVSYAFYSRPGQYG